jgi:hypothetical protein
MGASGSDNKELQFFGAFIKHAHGMPESDCSKVKARVEYGLIAHSPTHRNGVRLDSARS